MPERTVRTDLEETLRRAFGARFSSDVAALRDRLLEVLGGSGSHAVARKLGSGVYRLEFREAARRSVIVKALEPPAALRNRLAGERWLPAAGLFGAGPPLIGSAADGRGRWAWHIYEDLGDHVIDEERPAWIAVCAALRTIAQVHLVFATHPLLADVRLHGRDLGAGFLASSVRDAVRALEELRAPLTSERADLRERLLDRLYPLLGEEPDRAGWLREQGGPETLLHGDLWPSNVLVCPHAGGAQVRLIDWDRAGVGPAVYDLSAFLSRLPAEMRLPALELYQELVGAGGWRLPRAPELNALFEIVETARLADCALWAALGAHEPDGDWAFDDLQRVDEWWDHLEPLLPVRPTSLREARAS